MCSVADWKERLCVLFCSDRWKVVHSNMLAFKQIARFNVYILQQMLVKAFLIFVSLYETDCLYRFHACVLFNLAEDWHATQHL